MKYSEEQFADAIAKAAKKCGLDAHIYYLYKKSDMQTWADKLIGLDFRKAMAVKRSYMFCDSLDMTFFFDERGNAKYTYSGYADKRDASDEKIVNAFKKANKMRLEMERALGGME